MKATGHFETEIDVKPPRVASLCRLAPWVFVIIPFMLDGWLEPVSIICLIVVAVAAFALDIRWLWQHWGPRRVLRIRCSDQELWLFCADQSRWMQSKVRSKSMGRYWLRLELERSDLRLTSLLLAYPTVDSDACRRLRVLMRFLPNELMVSNARGNPTLTF